jgi:hypothetical protein
MPYQAKHGSLVIVLTTLAETLRTVEILSTSDGQPVKARDMDGREINLDVIPQYSASTKAEL